MRIEKTRNALKQMGYFSQVDIRPSPTGTPATKDIQIDVKEQSTGYLNLGVGFSSIDSLSGSSTLRKPISTSRTGNPSRAAASAPTCTRNTVSRPATSKSA